MAFTLPLGAEAPDFKLPGVDGKEYSLEGFKKAKVMIVVFSCNHCPAAIAAQHREKLTRNHTLTNRMF